MKKFDYDVLFESYEIRCSNTYIHGEWEYESSYDGDYCEDSFSSSFEYDECRFSIKAMYIA